MIYFLDEKLLSINTKVDVPTSNFVLIDNNFSSKTYSTILFDISINGAIKLSISYADKYFDVCNINLKN